MAVEYGRRSFLKRILIGAGAAVGAATAGSLLHLEALDGAGATLLDPERALWTPGAKAFFFPDRTIAIKNIRQATPAETAQVTGAHYVRVKFTDAAPIYDGKIVDARGRLWEADGVMAGVDVAPDQVAGQRGRSIEQIVMMTEAEFARTGAVAFATAKNIEVHFDSGTIAHHFNIQDAPRIAAIRATLTDQHHATLRRRAYDEAKRQTQWEHPALYAAVVAREAAGLPLTPQDLVTLRRQHRTRPIWVDGELYVPPSHDDD